jgi:TolA-binding protein
MKTLPAFFCALFLAASVSAQGVFNLAKQQAKSTTGQESPQQGGTPPVTPPPNPALQATLQNIAALRADFESLEASPTNTPPLAGDLTAAAQGAKPSAASVSGLAQDLAAVLGGNKNLLSQNQRLAQFVHAIFNSSHLSETQVQNICDGVQNILTRSGASADDTAKMLRQLKKIADATG